jgi:hypothetical protein
MAKINDVLDRISAIVETHTGLRCVDIVDKPPAPCAVVYPDAEIGEGDTYYQAFRRGVFDLPVIVQVLYPTTGLRTAQRAVNDHISPDGDTSIPRAIFEHPTLGTDPDENTAGTPTMTAHVAGVSEYGMVSSFDGATRYIGAKVHIAVKTRGDQ